MVAGIKRLIAVVTGAAALGLLALPASAAAQGTDALRERAKNGVVMIKSSWPTQSASGAGTVIAVNGQDIYIVTARHVVREEALGVALKVEVEFKARPKEWYTARVLDGEAGTYDIAALRVPLPSGLRAEQITGMGIAPANSAVRGTDVFPVGFPEGTEWSDPVAPDKVMSTRRENITFQSQFVREGHSGGPLLDSCGRVVGMVVERRPPEAYALPIDLLIDRLKEWSLPTTMLTVSSSGCATETNAVTPSVPAATAPTITDVRRMHRSEQWRDSLPILNRLIAEQPRSGELLALRSHAYSHLEQKAEALRDGEQAVSLAPRLAEAYLRRGEAKSTDNRYPEAIADYDKAIELDKNEAEAWGNKGGALASLDQNQKALEALNRAITLQAGRYEFWSVRGFVNSNLKNFTAAISDFSEAIRLRPEEPQLFVARANAYANARQNEPALADANQALKLKPDDPELLTVRGNIYALLGRTQAAKDDLSFALRLNPNVRFAADLLKRLEPAAPPAVAGGGGGAAPNVGNTTSLQYARLLDDTAAAMRAQRTAEASELLEQMVRLDSGRSEAWSLKGMMAMNSFDNLPAAHENFENALSRGGTIYFRVGHDHGADQMPCFGTLSLSPAGVSYAGETGHQFNWPLDVVTEAELNGFYGVLVGMFHIRVQADRRATTFNFAVVRSVDAQVINRRPDAEMLVGFINRLRQSRPR